MAVILYSQHSVYDIVHNFISMQSPIIDIFGLNVGTYKNTIRTVNIICCISNWKIIFNKAMHSKRDEQKTGHTEKEQN